MNITIAAVGVGPGFAGGSGSARDAIFIGGFIAVGLILLFAAGRLCRRGRGHIPVHAAHYTSPRL